MQDKNKLFPKSFRITEETSEKFRSITKELDLKNQEEALSKLIEVYEHQKGKETLPEMKETIDSFEGYLRSATSMFMVSLENNQNMRAMVRTEYESQLRSKDKLIEELQKTVEDAKSLASESEGAKEELLSRIEALQREMGEQAKTSEKAFSGYEKQIEELREQNRKLQVNYDELNETFKHFRDTARVIKNELELSQGQLEVIRTENEDLVAKYENAQKGYEDAIKNSKELDAIISEKNKQLKECEEHHKKALEEQKLQIIKDFTFDKEKALFDLEKKLTEEHQKKMSELLRGIE